MPLERAFRVSFYATIVMAFACLGLAELWFLPWIPGLLAIAAILIGVAYWLEGRWVLSERWANRLGIGIALATLVWISFQVPRSDEDLLRGGVPWPAGILPHVGPLLMILLLVKLFRPKPPTDVWVMHIIALIMVLLACILTGDFTFSFLLVGYLTCLLWSVSVYYQLQGNVVTNSPVQALPWRFMGIGKAWAWTLLGVFISVTAFLCVPRQGSLQWDPTQLMVRTRGRMIIQAGMDGHIDSARTGKVEIVDEIAFQIDADDAKGPKTDLDGSTRWRSYTLDCYTKGGRWRTGANDAEARFAVGNQAPNQNLPALAGDEFYLNIRFEAGRGVSQVLADPPTLGPLGEHPYVVLQPVPKNDKLRGIVNLFIDVPGTGTFHPLPRQVFMRPREYLYRQVVKPRASMDVIPAEDISDDYRAYLLEDPPPAELPKFTLDTLRNLDSLRETDFKVNALGRLPPSQHIIAAKALEDHLANSGVYTYSLNLRRADLKADPIVDFLINVKKGHCERYAGALALMLRSLGIPTRIVKGYRGVEAQGDGTYYIRQSQAHAWVEALVPDAVDAGRSNWLVLDPTPAFEDDGVSLSFLEWFSLRWRDTRILWRNMILEYDSDRQQSALRDLWRKVTRRDRMELWTNLLRGGAVVAGMLVVFWIGRKIHVRRRARLHKEASRRSPVAFYNRFVKILGRYAGVRPKPEQTPHEFGRTVAHLLNERKATTSDLPGQVVALLYRVRFGGELPAESETKDLELQVDRLERELKTGCALAQ